MEAISILMIEDNEVDREMIKKALSIFKPNMTEALTGEDALKLLSINKYHLILLDYKLPDIDGLTMIIKIRELAPDTPIIVVTGFGNEDLVKTTSELGVLDYIPKNKITPEFFTRTILNDLLIHKTQKQNQSMEKLLQDQKKKNIETLSEIIEMAKQKLLEYDNK